MRTSLVEIQEIENFLLKQGDVKEQLLVEAKMLLTPDLAEKVKLQSESYDLIHQYGREELRREIRLVEQEVFHSSRYRLFQQRIRSIFKR